MLRKLLPLCILSSAVATGQLPGLPPPITSATPSIPQQADSQPAAHPSAKPLPTPLSASERSQVIDGLAAHLTETYIFPDMAKEMVGDLQAHQKQGDYDAITDGAVLAARLTADLRSVSRDRHLHVEYFADKLPREEDPPTPTEEEKYLTELERTHCGFLHTEVLPGNIAFVQLNYFGPADVCAPTVAETMKSVSRAHAVIFDLRMNRGGDPAMVALLASYLFDRPTHLDDLYNRHENKTTQYWATPEKVTDRMPSQPVYVLTSRMSFSGAEQFCYDLRNLNRATIIGEKTGGAAHPTRNRRISDHFLIAVPEYLYINSVTRTDWEGEGVTPDVPTAPWNALMIAQKLAEARIQQSDTQPSLAPTPSR